MTNKNKPLSLKNSLWANQFKDRWKVVDTTGRILETFRTKLSARDWLVKNELYSGELQIAPLE